MKLERSSRWALLGQFPPVLRFKFDSKTISCRTGAEARRPNGAAHTARAFSGESSLWCSLQVVMWPGVGLCFSSRAVNQKLLVVLLARSQKEASLLQRALCARPARV